MQSLEREGPSLVPINEINGIEIEGTGMDTVIAYPEVASIEIYQALSQSKGMRHVLRRHVRERMIRPAARRRVKRVPA